MQDNLQDYLEYIMRVILIVIALLSISQSSRADALADLKQVIKTTPLKNGNELSEIEALLISRQSKENTPYLLFRYDNTKIAFSGVVMGYESNLLQCSIQSVVLKGASKGEKYVCLPPGGYSHLAFGDLLLSE